MGFDQFPAEAPEATIARYPRKNFKKGFPEEYFAGFAHKPATAYGIVNAALYERFVPGYRSPNACDQMAVSPFPDSACWSSWTSLGGRVLCLQKLNPGYGRPAGVGAPTCLIWLTVCAFAIGTEGFIIAGLVPALARDLNVGLPAAGHLVTAFPLAYVVGAPVMAVLTAGLELRRLLAVAMGGFALGSLLAALAPGDAGAGLLPARLVLALSVATFMPAANGYVAALGELSGVVALCRWSGTGW
jgi:Major Facilitator Superfamily